MTAVEDLRPGTIVQAQFGQRFRYSLERWDRDAYGQWHWILWPIAPAKRRTRLYQEDMRRGDFVVVKTP